MVQLYTNKYGEFAFVPYGKKRFQMVATCPHGNGIWYDESPSYSSDGEPAHYRDKYDHPYSYDSFFVIGNHDSIKKAGGDWTDRMVQWTSDKKYSLKWNRAMAAVKVFGNFHWSRCTLEQLNVFVKAYYGKNYKGVGLVESCNQSSGYPLYCVFSKKMTRKEIQARNSLKTS
jgi:hypothetical protein